ncbi:MAG: hypothetical protein EU540_04475 [Promethearchaeota archaeon]|nr:MAG: hypothetical protein EU540_04475 [Candidatus Lokiarchaeota archaeon]
MSNIEKWLEQLLTYREIPLEKENEEIQQKVDEFEKLAENIEERELEDDFHEQVQVAAYFISQAGLSYNDLCWLLAEKILKKTKKMGTPLSIRDTSKKAEDIFTIDLSYAELCWLNGEMDIIIKKFFDKE